MLAHRPGRGRLFAGAESRPIDDHPLVRSVGDRLATLGHGQLVGDPTARYIDYNGPCHNRRTHHCGLDMMQISMDADRRLSPVQFACDRCHCSFLGKRQDPWCRQNRHITRAVGDGCIGVGHHQARFSSQTIHSVEATVPGSASGGTQVVRLDRKDAVFVLTMDDGENRMNREWLDAVNGALDEVDGSADPLALVTTGAGKFFSNGLDLEWLFAGGADMPSFVADVERLFARVLAAPYITVAACNGHTFAAGAMLALAHDFRVMRSDRGFFCLPEVDIKIPFTPGMNSLIMSRITNTTAHEVMVTGRRFGGDEAADLHIVHRAVLEDEVLPTAVAIAAAQAGKDRNTLATIKERMYSDTIRLLQNSPGTHPS